MPKVASYTALTLVVLVTCPEPRQTGLPPCSPSADPAVIAERRRLEPLTQAGDPLVLFSLAADYAALCKDESTFRTLERMAATYGGLDPADYRGFARLRDVPRFRAIVAAIRRDNPPIVRSRRAFILGRRALFPEGMAYDSATKRVFAGSATARQVVWTDAPAGILHDFVRPGQDGLGIVAGLHVDSRRHHLWAVSTGASGPGSSSVVRGLFQYDLSNASLIARYALPDTTSLFTLNDVVVVPSTGEAYTTQTGTGAISVAEPGTPRLIEFLPPGSIPGANGIVVTPDERALLVAGDSGIARIDRQTRRVTMLAKPPNVITASIDGLYRYRTSLVGIQNGVHPGRVVQFDVDSGFTRILGGRVLETYNPEFENPTTGAIDGDSFLFMANPQLHKWAGGSVAVDTARISSVMVLRLPLRQFSP